MNFVLLTQALDGVSPDYVQIDGQEVDPTDEVAQNAAYSISKIGRENKRKNEKYISLIRSKDYFVLEIRTPERDKAGRVVPLVYCGRCNSEYQKIDFIQNAITKFAQNAGRSIPESHLHEIESLLKKNQKKIT